MESPRSGGSMWMMASTGVLHFFSLGALLPIQPDLVPRVPGAQAPGTLVLPGSQGRHGLAPASVSPPGASSALAASSDRPCRAPRSPSRLTS